MQLNICKHEHKKITRLQYMTDFLLAVNSSVVSSSSSSGRAEHSS